LTVGGVGVVAGSEVEGISDDLTVCVLAELQPTRKAPESNRTRIARESVLNVRLDIKHSPFS